MTEEQFWYGDLRLFNAYEIQYYRHNSYVAWLHGVHTFEAHSKAISNGNRTKQSDPIEKYSDWVDPTERLSKPIITKDNLEYEFRKQQERQNSWLFGK